MATQIDIQQQLNYYIKRRNHFLFFIISPLLIPISLYSMNHFYSFVNSNILDTIIFFFAIGYFIFLTVLKSKLSIYTMYLNYYLILNDEVGIQSLGPDFDSKNIQEKVNKKGYVTIKSDEDYSINLFKNLSQNNYFEKKDVTVLFIYIKKPEIDFYNEKLHDELTNVYDEIERGSQPIRHQITLFINAVNDLNDNTIDKCQKIVNVAQANRSLIQINIAINRLTNLGYYLAPRKRYPNRMYYEAVKEINRVIPFKEVMHLDKT